jgi:hypothetical protein
MVVASEKQAKECCQSESPKPSDDSSLNVHGCGKCGVGWQAFEQASQCCRADHVTCPLADLPADAFIGHGLEYNYGKAFTGNWELVHNKGPVDKAVRVYPLPPLLAKMVEDIFRVRYEAGRDCAQKQIRDALGIRQEVGYEA